MPPGESAPDCGSSMRFKRWLLILPRLAYLWTLDEPLRPQASAACRQNIAKAILYVGLGHLAAVAEHARRKVEFLQPLAQEHVVWLVP